jgi:hypothetical protein
MKKILALFLIHIYLFGDDGNLTEKELRTQKAIKNIQEQEKRFAKEQKFYRYDNYDFQGAKINKKSLDSIRIIEPEDDFDMTHVYD